MPKTKFNVTLDSEVVKELKKKAVDEGKSASKIIQELLVNYLSMQPQI